MNKKVYQQPAMQVVKIQHSQMLCSSPGAHDEVGKSDVQFSRQHDGWFENEDE